MSCTDIVCGTGGWVGPQPGDPDNNVSLAASPAIGGIVVIWSYPNINPHAVAHTILKRGISGDYSLAVEQAIVAGNTYFDRIPDEEIRQYFYWIQLVSVHGTVGEPIGPAVAIPRSQTAATLEELTGLIDEGVLATTLRERIGIIDVLNQDIAQEILDRVHENQALADALAAVSSQTGDALTYLNQEITERTNANEAIIHSLNAMAVGMADNAAAIVNEQTLRATATEALAEDVEILYANTAENTAAIINEQQARTSAESATAQTLSGLVSSVNGVTAALQTEKTARVTADSALTVSVNSMVSKVNDVAAGVSDISSTQIGYAARKNTATPYDGNGVTIVYPAAEYPANDFPQYAANRTRIIDRQGVLNWNASSAGVSTPLDWVVGLPIASAVRQVGVVGPSGTYASLEQSFTAQAALNNQFKGMYTAKVDVNGLVGGFGIYNDGATVEAAFDVDLFWVGRTTNQVKPFIVSGGTVYIDKARIKNADIDTLKIAGNAVILPFGNVFVSTTESSRYVDFTISGLGAGETVTVIINISVVAWTTTTGIYRFDSTITNLGTGVSELIQENSGLHAGPTTTITKVTRGNGSYRITTNMYPLAGHPFIPGDLRSIAISGMVVKR